VTGSSPAFYFDLASPLAYLVAEQVTARLASARWTPVLAARLRDADAPAGGAEEQREHVERRARELGLQPLRWPDPYPFDSGLAMRVATYAASIGRAVPFALAAYRQAFAAGRCLADPDSVVIAAAACEMHPAAVLRAGELRSIHERLAQETAAAAAAGVTEVPTIVLPGASAGARPRMFTGEAALDLAAWACGVEPAGSGRP
jgi:2-hydroxychromene-2-carboxylate isomerase